MLYFLHRERCLSLKGSLHQTHSFIGFNYCWIQARLSHRRIRIVQIVTTTDNQRTVGLLIPNAAVEAVLQGYIHNFYGCLPPLSDEPRYQLESLRV